MPNTTRALILDTFGRLLEQMPFEKITVSAIIKACGISRNTFYYHFEDIYDLLDHWLEQELGKYKDRTDDDNWTENVKVFLHSCKSRKRMIYHLFDSLSRDRLERYLFSATDNSIYEFVARRAEGMELSSQRLQVISNICRYAVFGYFIRFLWNGMNDDIDKSVDELNQVFSIIIHEAVNSPASEAQDGKKRLT